MSGIEKTDGTSSKRDVPNVEGPSFPVNEGAAPRIEINFIKKGPLEEAQEALQYLNEHSTATESDYQRSYTEIMQAARKAHDKGENDLWDRYVNGWKEDFKDVDDFGSAVSAVVKRTRKGFKAMDVVNPLTYIKEPVKDAAKKVDEMVSDGDPSTMTAGEKLWNATKGAGNVVDYLTSTEGLWVTSTTILTAGVAIDTALGAAPQLAAAAPALNSALGTAGVGITGKGVYDVATAENEEDAQKGGAEILTGGLMTGGAVAASKNSLSAARQAGVPAKDPATLSTLGAVKENFRVAGQGLKVAAGLEAPTMGANIPASAFRMESKPNEVEAYQTTGKADGIVYEKDGKLFVPNKWNPEAPYEVKDGSIIMIYDRAGGDFAVCDPKIFAKTYVNGQGSYDAMKGIKPGETIHATKKAVGGFEIVPEGTKVRTLEGDVTVKQGQAVMYDVDGNPYVGDINKSLLKRNVPVDDASARMFERLKNPDAPIKPGFTDDYTDMLANQGWGDLYGPSLVKETQQATIMLETEMAKGTPLTKELVENILMQSSPGASGGSYWTQLRILANKWQHGDIILNLYNK